MLGVGHIMELILNYTRPLTDVDLILLGEVQFQFNFTIHALNIKAVLVNLFIAILIHYSGL